MNEVLIIANWKMNGTFEMANQWADEFFAEVKKYRENLPAGKTLREILPQVVICPPFTLISSLSSSFAENRVLLSGREASDDISDDDIMEIISTEISIKVGAQNCHTQDSGAYTGSVSAEMILDMGADFVILGHSERREHNFETNQGVKEKVVAAISNNLFPVVCFGESAEERGEKAHLKAIGNQVLKSLPKEVNPAGVIFAYEPIWAIGSGKTPTEAEIKEVSAYVRRLLAEKRGAEADSIFILYGGSINSANARSIVSIEGIDGLLVGGASLNPKDFFNIVKLEG